MLTWFSRRLREQRRYSPLRRRLRLWEAVLLTAPILILPFILGFGAARDYLSLRQYDDWWASGAGVATSFSARLRLIAAAPAAKALEQSLAADPGEPVVVRLTMPPRTWRWIQMNKQSSWDTWFDVGILQGREAIPAELRRRGDTSVHWTTSKMSFTLKSSRTDLFKGFPELAFSVKDVLQHYVAASLVPEFDLIAPHSTVAPVFINQRFYGVYRITEPIGEPLLRRLGHVPGNVFRGDAAERGDARKGVPRNLFVNPAIWDVVARKSGVGRPDDSTLKSFISDLNGASFEDHLRVLSRLDREEIARLVALLLVTGDPFHMDGVHNQFWYEDPSTGRLRPIPWDLRILDLASPATQVNPLLRQILRDPFIVDAALREAYLRVRDDAIVELAGLRARSAYDRYEPYFRFDHYRGSTISDVGTPDPIVRTLRLNAALLREWAADARVAVSAQTTPGQGVVLDLETRGHAGADLRAIATSGDGRNLRLHADRNRNGTLDAGDDVIATSWTDGRLVLESPEALLAGWEAPLLESGGRGIEAGAVHYRFFLTGSAVERAVVGLKPVIVNRLTGEPAELLDWAPGVARTPSHSWSPWQFTVPRGRTIRWSGVVELRDTTHIGSQDTLVIAPGTTVRLRPDISLVAHGPVFAQGTPASPITFEPVLESYPWGTVALQGEGASGSRFEYATFRVGGGATVDGIEYTGMVSVHGARDVVMRAITLRDNLRSDDAFRAVHATVTLIDCVVTNANGDAIDFDYSDGEVSGCRIEDAYGDGISLMASSPRVVGNRVSGSGISGLSVGGASRPLVFRNTITASRNGLEVKDAAEPWLLNNTVTRNGRGLYERRDDWRYGAGGWARLVNNVVSGNTEDFDLDNSSRITETEQTARASAVSARSVGGDVDGLNGWLYAALGLRTPGQGRGSLDESDMVEPVKPLYSGSFRENFASTRDGWTAADGVARLDKRGGALVAGFELRPGAFMRTVDWDVSGNGATLVLELAGRDIDSVSIVITGRDNVVERRVLLPTTERRFAYVTVPLPVGHYSSVRIGAWPRWGVTRVDSRTGFVDVRDPEVHLASWQVFPSSTTGLADSPVRISEGRQ